jgi:hypothetical protein
MVRILHTDFLLNITAPRPGSKSVAGDFHRNSKIEPPLIKKAGTRTAIPKRIKIRW